MRHEREVGDDQVRGLMNVLDVVQLQYTHSIVEVRPDNSMGSLLCVGLAIIMAHAHNAALKTVPDRIRLEGKHKLRLREF